MSNDLASLVKRLYELESEDNSRQVVPQERHETPAELGDQHAAPALTSLVQSSYEKYWRASVEDLQSQWIAISTIQQSLERSGVESRLNDLRQKLLHHRDTLTAALGRCGISSSRMIALTEAPEYDETVALISDMPAVWAEASNDTQALAQTTAKLRLFQKIALSTARVAQLSASQGLMSQWHRREKRMTNDLDDVRVTLEFIEEVRDAVTHVERMVHRSALDEDALLRLNRATIIEEEKARRHLAMNDVRGLKSLLNCPKLKAVEQAAILPETSALAALLARVGDVERTTFADVGECRAAWRHVHEDCFRVLEMVRATRATRADRARLAGDAFGLVRDALAEKAIAALR